MKYCRYCGRQLSDDETCFCHEKKEAAVNRNDATSIQCTNDIFGKIQKGILQFCKTYIGAWRNPAETIENVIRKKNYGILVIQGLILLACTLLFYIFFFLKVENWTGELLGGIGSWLGISNEIFDFPKVLLTSIIMFVLTFLGNTLLPFILTRFHSDQTTLFYHFSCASVFSLPTASILLCASLLSLLNPLVGLAVAIVSEIYYFLGCLLIVQKSGSDNDKVSYLYVNTIVISAYVLTLVYAFAKLLVWNINILA